MSVCVENAVLAPVGAGRLLPDPGVGAGLVDHLRRLGPLPRWDADALVAAVGEAGLTGRGGAGFPTARKISAVRGRKPPVVIVNCCESDPTSTKDAVLIAAAPHLVLDGAVLLRDALGARRVLLAVHVAAPAGPRLATALAERADAAGLELLVVPDRYVASEASSLVSLANTGDARPLGRLRPIRERGVGGAPTLVDNAETVTHLALIARFGADWYRSVGTAGDPGSRLVAVHGVGVREVPGGVRLRELVPRGRFALVGGLGGRWHDLFVADEQLSGLGSVVPLPDTACLLAETARIADVLARASAGRCGPCMFGLPAIAEDLRLLDAGDTVALQRLQRRLPVVDGRGGCGHPDGAVRMIGSMLPLLTGPLADHLAQHLAGRRCPPVAGLPWSS